MEEETREIIESLDKNFFVNWYEKRGRNFPWRRNNISAFKILVTEILLKQTKARDVAIKWNSFTNKYSCPNDILDTNLQKIKEEIEDLGFGKTRSNALKLISVELANNHSSKVPIDLKALLKLPYVGLYTANAVMCFGYGEKNAIVDNNILRLFSRIINKKVKQRDIRRNPWVWEIAEYLLPNENYISHNYGLLDFTAEICQPKKPNCKECPLILKCHFEFKNL